MYGPEDVATGRGVTYEWEQFLFEVFDRLATVESAGGGGSAGTGASYVHTQAVAAGTWTVTHGLGTKPVVAVVSTVGGLIVAQVDYPSDNVTALTFGRPYAGTAYFRG